MQLASVSKLLTCSADTAEQLGVGNNAAILDVFRWDPVSREYLVVGPGEAWPAGTVLWLRASAADTLQVQGTYTEPGDVAIVAGGDFVPAPGFESLTLSQLPPEVARAWQFDAQNQAWKGHFTGELAYLSQIPDTLAPGTALYLQATAPATWPIPPPAERVRYYHQDHLGSSNVVADANGTLVEEVAFYAFGHPRNTHSPAGTCTTRYLFTQKERDEESGLQYFEARYLSGNLARFVSVDPLVSARSRPNVAAVNRLPDLSNPQLLNPYAYGANNPPRFFDPTGLEPEEPPRVLYEDIVREDRGLQREQDAVMGFILPTPATVAAAFVNPYVGLIVSMLSSLESVQAGDRAAQLRNLQTQKRSLERELMGNEGMVRKIRETEESVKGHYARQAIFRDFFTKEETSALNKYLKTWHQDIRKLETRSHYIRTTKLPQVRGEIEKMRLILAR